ncbi:MAG: ABC transporter ATP-binding protein [Chloroflexota bacterium]|nr:ABC transporter ATP-binding protein [Chloroflexota bacterium]
MTAVLEIQGLHTYYGHIHALKGVDVSVNKGEIVTLIGSNGAGKSTTLRTISGIARARQGSIKLAGKDITNNKPHEVTAMGIAHVPEGRRIFPELTVRENLEIGAWSVQDKNAIQERMETAFGFFPRIKERLFQKGGTLSGGEQQMLAISRALMSDPDILLLDEPSMGLAPVLVELIFEIILKINAQGKTILLVEQNALMALEIASRGYVLQTGQIVLKDSAAALMTNDSVRKAYLGES